MHPTWKFYLFFAVAPAYFIDLLQKYADAGANHINVVFVPVDKAPGQLELFAEKVLPHFR